MICSFGTLQEKLPSPSAVRHKDFRAMMLRSAGRYTPNSKLKPTPGRDL
jgi:hypothetical protein